MLAQNRLPPDAPRPIDAAESLWAEELTSMEIRDALRAGTTTIIIGTGGVEQNGPYVAGGKHNYVLQTVLPYIARAIGKALIAPIVKFVPEGSIEPTPPGTWRTPGTISLEAGDVRGAADRHLPQLQGARLRRHRAARRQRRQPDRHGESRGGAEPEVVGRAAAGALPPEYYDEDQWSYNYLKSLGITQIDQDAAGRAAAGSRAPTGATACTTTSTTSRRSPCRIRS